MASEAPEQVIALVVIVSVPEVDHLNAALIVKSVHRIQPLSKAARWHGNFHDKWKVAGDGLAAWAAFVTAGHNWPLLNGWAVKRPKAGVFKGASPGYTFYRFVFSAMHLSTTA
jgi:hypothetical protein